MLGSSVLLFSCSFLSSQWVSHLGSRYLAIVLFQNFPPPYQCILRPFPAPWAPCCWCSPGLGLVSFTPLVSLIICILKWTSNPWFRSELPGDTVLYYQTHTWSHPKSGSWGELPQGRPQSILSWGQLGFSKERSPEFQSHQSKVCIKGTYLQSIAAYPHNRWSVCSSGVRYGVYLRV